MNQENLIFSKRGNGKLLLTGEYLVLKGAKALSVPLQYGQEMEVYSNTTPFIIWKSYQRNQRWNEVILGSRFEIIETTDDAFATRLVSILKQCLLMSDAIQLNDILSKTFVTHLDFDVNWGLGTSSTLLYCLAIFFQIDAYQLQLKTFQGSGYDVAIAGIHQPIIYQLSDGPQVQKVHFKPSFRQNLYFVYSGKKMSSLRAISNFMDKEISKQAISDVSYITELILSTDDLDGFMNLMSNHESIIGKLIQQVPIQKIYFSDFQGVIKSLGAWGGDFYMAASQESKQYVKEYFLKKGYEIIISYDNMILNDNE